MNNRWGLWLGIIVVALVVWLGIYTGFFAQLPLWSRLVANDMTSRIEGLLGQEEVMRRRALDSIQLARTDIDRLQDLAIASSVDAELLSEKVNSLRIQAAAMREELSKLATVLDKGKTVSTESGTEWQIADIKTLAQTKIVEYKTLQQQIAVYEQSQKLQTETSLRARSAALSAQQNVANMEASLELLDAKIALLRTMQNQSYPDNSQVTPVFRDSENLLHTLLSQVEREIRITQERTSLRAMPAFDQAEPDAPLLPATIAEPDLVGQLFDLAQAKE